MSVEEFQATLEKRGREVEERLAQVHGEEHSRLEKELAEVHRQLVHIEPAHADAVRKNSRT